MVVFVLTKATLIFIIAKQICVAINQACFSDRTKAMLVCSDDERHGRSVSLDLVVRNIKTVDCRCELKPDEGINTTLKVTAHGDIWEHEVELKGKTIKKGREEESIELSNATELIVHRRGLPRGSCVTLEAGKLFRITCYGPRHKESDEDRTSDASTKARHTFQVLGLLIGTVVTAALVILIVALTCHLRKLRSRRKRTEEKVMESRIQSESQTISFSKTNPMYNPGVANDDSYAHVKNYSTGVNEGNASKNNPLINVLELKKSSNNGYEYALVEPVAVGHIPTASYTAVNAYSSAISVSKTKRNTDADDSYQCIQSSKGIKKCDRSEYNHLGPFFVDGGDAYSEATVKPKKAYKDQTGTVYNHLKML